MGYNDQEEWADALDCIAAAATWGELLFHWAAAPDITGEGPRDLFRLLCRCNPAQPFGY